MPWLGRKKIAFIPLHRPNAHPPDEPIPADWPAEILRRVYYDPNAFRDLPDRSLRTYIHTVSSGLADLDATVLPMEVLDQQDVPPDALEGKLGASLRAQGFDAAALVMLGQPPTGQGEVDGFWARFDMSETLGTWSMELMHCPGGDRRPVSVRRQHARIRQHGRRGRHASVVVDEARRASGWTPPRSRSTSDARSSTTCTP